MRLCNALEIVARFYCRVGEGEGWKILIPLRGLHNSFQTLHSGLTKFGPKCFVYFGVEPGEIAKQLNLGVVSSSFEQQAFCF